MSEATRSQGVAHGTARSAQERFGSVLVPLDLSPGSGRLLGRITLLPLAANARLTLLHVIPKALSSRAQQSAARDAKEVLAEEARNLRKTLPEEVIIDQAVQVGAAATEIAACATAVGAELIVMGRGRERGLRDVVLGSTAERVIRRCQSPVLVVRLSPQLPYARPAIAVDLDEAAHEVVALLLRVLPPPRAPVRVIHAYDVPYEGSIYPSLSEEEEDEHRERYRCEAVREIDALLAAALAEANVSPKDAPSWATHVRRGSPRMNIARTVDEADTDLLMLGTHGHSGLAHALLGTVAGDVLRAVTCDVLVVPPRPRSTAVE